MLGWLPAKIFLILYTPFENSTTRTAIVGISSGVLIGLFDLLNPKYVCIIYACMMVLKYDYAAHRS